MIRRLPIIAVALGATVLTGCFTAAPRFRSGSSVGSASIAIPIVSSTTTKPIDPPEVSPSAISTEEGIASYYADEFNGRKTSSGEIFDMHKLTCAHKTFAFGTKLRVVNLDNGRTTEVTVNDRGPFVADRIVDLSLGAAQEIGLVGPGTARVRLEVMEWGKGSR